MSKIHQDRIFALTGSVFALTEQHSERFFYQENNKNGAPRLACSLVYLASIESIEILHRFA